VSLGLELLSSRRVRRF